MASMRFDNETVFKIQELIEEKKSEINEADYIKMCNVTKCVHNMTKRSTEQQEAIRMVRNVFGGPDVPAYNTTLRFPLSCDNIEIRKLEADNERLNKEIKKLENFDSKMHRVTHDDKYTSLLDYCSKHNVTYQIHPKFNTLAKKIKILEDRLLDSCVDPQVLDRIYRAQMSARVAYIKEANIEILQKCKVELEQNKAKLLQLRAEF